MFPYSNNLKKNLFSIQIELTDRCNLKCKHCYQGKLSKTKKELDIYLVLTQCKELSSFFKDKQILIRFSGGEPLLRDDIISILVNTHLHGFWTEIITNATLIDLEKSYGLRFSGLKFAQVSLDSGFESKNDFIRGNGSYEKTLYGINNLIKSDISVSLKTTLMKGINTDYSDIKELFSLALYFGIKSISFARFLPLGRSKNNFDFILSPNELNQTFKYIIEIGKNFPDIIFEIKEPLVNLLDEKFFPNNMIKTRCCIISKSYLAIGFDGKVYGCRRLNLPIGNIKKTTLSKIWFSGKKLKQITPGYKLPVECINCNLKKKCLGGCKALSYSITGDYNKIDPGCWNKNTLNLC